MKDFIIKRKVIKRAVARKMSMSPDDLVWLDGRLCFKENNQPIFGVPQIPKPPEEQTVIRFSPAADNRLFLRKVKYFGRRFT